MANNDDRLLSQHVYPVVAALQTYSEQARWARLNTFLVLDSFLFAGWTTVFLHDKSIEGKVVLLLLFPLVGAALGIIWAVLGHRSNRYHDALQDLGANLESRAEMTDGPFHEINRIRGLIPRSGNKFSSSTWIVKWVPILYTLLFLLALLLTVWREWSDDLVCWLAGIIVNGVQ